MNLYGEPVTLIFGMPPADFGTVKTCRRPQQHQAGGLRKFHDFLPHTPLT